MRIRFWGRKPTKPKAKKPAQITVKSLHSDILDLKRTLTLRLFVGLFAHLALGYWAHTYLYTPWNDARYATQAYMQEMQATIKSELVGEIQKGFSELKAKSARQSPPKTTSWSPFQK